VINNNGIFFLRDRKISLPSGGFGQGGLEKSITSQVFYNIFRTVFRQTLQFEKNETSYNLCKSKKALKQNQLIG